MAAAPPAHSTRSLRRGRCPSDGSTRSSSERCCGTTVGALVEAGSGLLCAGSGGGEAGSAREASTVAAGRRIGRSAGPAGSGAPRWRWARRFRHRTWRRHATVGGGGGRQRHRGVGEEEPRKNRGKGRTRHVDPSPLHVGPLPRHANRWGTKVNGFDVKYPVLFMMDET